MLHNNHDWHSRDPYQSLATAHLSLDTNSQADNSIIHTAQGLITGQRLKYKSEGRE